MTRTTNARVAGFTFLFYIAAGVAGMVLFDGATGTEGIAGKLARIGQHASDVRITVLLSLLCCVAALAWLGVVASVLLVLGLPLQLAGFLGGPVTWLMWLPMLVFEVVLGLWLLIKGVATPARR